MRVNGRANICCDLHCFQRWAPKTGSISASIAHKASRSGPICLIALAKARKATACTRTTLSPFSFVEPGLTHFKLKDEAFPERKEFSC